MLVYHCIQCGCRFNPNDSEKLFCPACRGLTQQIGEAHLTCSKESAFVVNTQILREKSQGDTTTEKRHIIEGTYKLRETSISHGEQDILFEWKVGDVIYDLYEVKAVHSGGMGLVYRVHHRKWNIDLAVKTPKLDFFKTEKDKENFIRECETWVDLGLYPHIVSCFYVQILGGVPRIFAEYVEGGSLKDWIKSRKLYEGDPQKVLERILDIAIQIAWGIGYAHEKGLIHQDIKPANIMMTPTGVAKVTDWGLVKARKVAVDKVTPTEESVLVSCGGMTRQYCSSEQASGLNLSRKTDIWSFGVSILEMFVGEVTWMSGEVAPYVLKNYLETGIKDKDIPKMPASLAELLKECFQYNPDDRPRDMKEVAERLCGIYREVIGREYFRQAPEAIELLADSLNNKAMSLLELGHNAEAMQCWHEALKENPHHLESNLNLLYYKWQSGLISIEDALKFLDMLIPIYEKEANFWYQKFLLEFEMTRNLDFFGRAIESACKALMGESKEEIMVLAKRLIDEEISKWSHPGRGGIWETSKLVLQRLMQEKFKETFDVYETEKCVTCVLFLGEGKLLTADENGFIKLHYYATCQNERVWRFASQPIRALSKGSNSTVLVDYVNKMVLLNIETDEIYEMEHDSVEEFFHLCANNKYALSKVKKVKWIGHDFGVTEVTWFKINLWNLFERKIEASVELNWGEDVIASSPDGDYLITRTESKFFLYKIHSSEKIHLEFSYPLSAVTFVAPNLVVACSYFIPYVYLIMWKIENQTLEKTTTILLGPGSPFYSSHTAGLDIKQVIGFDYTGKYLFTLTKNDTIQLWEWEKKTLLKTYYTPAIFDEFGIPSYSHRVMLTLDEKSQDLWIIYRHFQDNKWIAVKTSIQRKIFSYMLVSPVKYEILYQENQQCRQILSSAEKLIAEHSYKEAYQSLMESALRYPSLAKRIDFINLVYLCGCKRGKRKTLKDYYFRKQIIAHQENVSALDFGPNKQFCSGSWDRTIKVWNIPDLKLIKTLMGHHSGVDVVLYSSDGRYILSGSHDTTIRLWDANTGECLRVFEGHSQGISCLAFSPNMKLIASGSWDTTVRVWNIATGQCVALLEGGIHTMKVSSVKFINDYTVFSSDAIRVAWDIRTGQWKSYRGSPSFSWYGNTGAITIEGKTIKPPHKKEIMCTTLSSDGRFLITGSADYTICLFELLWEFEFPEPADWDEGARPYLEIFLALHTPYGPDGISKQGKPQWTEEDFQKLLTELGLRGYGWLKPEGIRRKLEEMSRNFKERDVI